MMARLVGEAVIEDAGALAGSLEETADLAGAGLANSGNSAQIHCRGSQDLWKRSKLLDDVVND